MGKHCVPASAIIRINPVTLGWYSLSEVDQIVAITIPKVIVGANAFQAQAEADRLNALNGDKNCLYLSIHARVRDVSTMNFDT